jgi:autotransporter-associated beta strand protein
VPYTVTGGTIGGSAELVVSGGGLVTLDNINDFNGGAVVSSGTLVLGNAGALEAGSALTVGDSSAFAPQTLTLSSGASTFSPAIVVVPEPGTLALLAAGVATMAVRTIRRRKR